MKPQYHLESEINKQIDEMLNKNIIEKSASPWASGVVLAKKKDGSLRFCVDYRRLNATTVKDAYPLPRIDYSLDSLSGSKWFSTLDLCSGYWQVKMDDSDKLKTAFATKRGLFHFNVMPFGLCNAPATFERLMKTVLSGLQWQICLVYLDDIIVIRKTFANMLDNLKQVFDRLLSSNLKLKAKKCHLFHKTVQFLGHVVPENGISTDPSKISVVEDWSIPVNLTEVKSFLGLRSYYRRFIPNFATIAKPLNRLTEKGTKFVWTKPCQDSFDSLRRALISAPFLAHPDFSKPFILDTDASDVAIGVVLSQVHNGMERVIAYASRTLSKAERKYCVTRKELLAVVYFTKYYKHYLYGKEFLVRTDHSSLKWLLNCKNPEGQLARWFESLSNFQIIIEHRAGTKHKNADALSRIPCRKTCCAEEKSMVNSTSCPPSKDDDSLKDKQAVDTDIAQVSKWVASGIKPNSEELSSYSQFVKGICAH